MEEQIIEEEIRDVYVPRPAWQVWGARIGVVIMLISVALWLYYIAFPI